MGLIQVDDYSVSGWRAPETAEARARWFCERLEDGEILMFAQAPFEIAAADRAFLLEARQTKGAHHKNISYKPDRDRISGAASGSIATDNLRRVMRSYSQNVISFIGHFLVPYAGRWRVDFASFRAIEEEGRNLPLRSRNDLLHVDSFPTRPSNGDRILRVFTNLNPSKNRVWLTGEPFASLAERYRAAAGIGKLADRFRSPGRPLRRALLRFGNKLGLPVVDRPLYDEFMLGFHHYLKANSKYQRESVKSKWEFPPGATWIVFTDQVPHAVLSGQFALEQTFLVNRNALLAPEKAPFSILQKLAGVPVTG